MEKLAIQLGKTGSILGALAGLIELSIGTRILPWIGNKESPVVLGFVTLILSSVAFLFVQSARKHVVPTNDRKLATFLGVLLPAAICFTTVGRLWYLPGSLLLLTSFLLAYTYWFCQSKENSSSKVSKKYRVNQIIAGIGSLLILASVALAFFINTFGLFRSEILVKAGRYRFEVLPMDIVRSTNLSGRVAMVEDIEVSLVMYAYIFLILGAAIALISTLVKSRIFKKIGGILVFTDLALFLFWLPGILAQTEFPSDRFQNIIGFLGLGWYISTIGMSLIIITSLFQLKPGNGKS